MVKPMTGLLSLGKNGLVVIEPFRTVRFFKEAGYDQSAEK